jgi:hypothetical protein
VLQQLTPWEVTQAMEKFKERDKQLSLRELTQAMKEFKQTDKNFQH